MMSVAVVQCPKSTTYVISSRIKEVDELTVNLSQSGALQKTLIIRESSLCNLLRHV